MTVYNELNLSEIKATGWIKKYLETQANGLTGEMGNVGVPFSLCTWGERDDKMEKFGENFLGGMVTQRDNWVPYEQNGYWIDGAIRAGRLIDNQKLIELASKKIYPEIDMIDEDGFIGPCFLKDGLTWAHAVYFRALIAEYTATRDEKIIEALKRHFLRRPLKEVYETCQDGRNISVRNIAEIETALWLYGQTKDERFLQMSEESYEVYNEIYSDDSEARYYSETRDLTIVGMLANRKVQRNHGVTYCEMCKIAAILHLYTGKEIYKKAAVNAFDKLYRDQMIVDGVFSSTEYLNGNEDSWAMHETCNVSDLTWALGYLYMITGDKKYGDWVENAVFNAGLGSVDDDFKGNQYFSCPNQVVANDNCNHAKFRRGSDWMSFSPKSFLACCAGNVNRFMPNYVCRSWMRNGDTLAAFTYGPSEICVMIGDTPITIEEITSYPFENTVRFVVHAKSPTSFTLVLREPGWAVKSTMTLNGKVMKDLFVNGVCKLTRTFADGDEIVLSFEDEIELIENAKGISVKKGPLLYALPVEEEVVIEGLRDLGHPDFPHYSLYPKSKWNYGLCINKKRQFVFTPGEVGEEPWRAEQNGLKIQVKAKELLDWKLKKCKKVQISKRPRKQCVWEEKEAIFTPLVPTVKKNAKLGEECSVTLIPYATTRLRIGIFPIIDV